MLLCKLCIRNDDSVHYPQWRQENNMTVWGRKRAFWYINNGTGKIILNTLFITFIPLWVVIVYQTVASPLVNPFHIQPTNQNKSTNTVKSSVEYWWQERQGKRVFLEIYTRIYLYCCVLSGRGLGDELIARPEESYRLWCVVVCDLETSWIRKP